MRHSSWIIAGAGIYRVKEEPPRRECGRESPSGSDLARPAGRRELSLVHDQGCTRLGRAVVPPGHEAPGEAEQQVQDAAAEQAQAAEERDGDLEPVQRGVARSDQEEGDAEARQDGRDDERDSAGDAGHGGGPGRFRDGGGVGRVALHLPPVVVVHLVADRLSIAESEVREALGRGRRRGGCRRFGDVDVLHHLAGLRRAAGGGDRQLHVEVPLGGERLAHDLSVAHRARAERPLPVDDVLAGGGGRELDRRARGPADLVRTEAGDQRLGGVGDVDALGHLADVRGAARRGDRQLHAERPLGGERHAHHLAAPLRAGLELPSVGHDVRAGGGGGEGHGRARRPLRPIDEEVGDERWGGVELEALAPHPQLTDSLVLSRGEGSEGVDVGDEVLGIAEGDLGPGHRVGVGIASQGDRVVAGGDAGRGTGGDAGGKEQFELGHERLLQGNLGRGPSRVHVLPPKADAKKYQKTRVLSTIWGTLRILTKRPFFDTFRCHPF